ncbi:MAG: MYG1 family protein [Myxococcota bacterium]
MSVLVATHDGPFHADDVMAFALICTFHDPGAQVVRTRDPDKIAAADLVIDVGGSYDPAAGRFDHHQKTYEGPWSSAGMVLDWLRATGAIDPELADTLRTELMDYLDGVDNGRITPRPGVPCFPRIVEALNHPAKTHAAFDDAFREGAAFAGIWLRGLVAAHQAVLEARVVVRRAMDEAAAAGRRVIVLDAYLPWKPVYFANGGEAHPTEFVLHPGTDGSWRAVAIPPTAGSMAQKRPFPAAWAGLTDQALEDVTGVPGSVFCHKNRFIAVFKSREAALVALERHGLSVSSGEAGDPKRDLGEHHPEQR